MANRDFKGVWIPKEVWLNKDLTVMEKLFLVEIDSLDNENGCFASNKYFSEFFDISKGRCTQIIKALEAKTLIQISLEYEGKNIKRRTITLVNKLNRVVNKLNLGSENIKHPYLENAEDNNTYINNTYNNLSEKSKNIKLPPWSDDQSWVNLGSTLGMNPRAGEDWPTFKNRVKHFISGE